MQLTLLNIAEFFLADNKFNVATGVLLIIFVGIIACLFYFEKRLRKLEK